MTVSGLPEAPAAPVVEVASWGRRFGAFIIEHHSWWTVAWVAGILALAIWSFRRREI